MKCRSTVSLGLPSAPLFQTAEVVLKRLLYPLRYEKVPVNLFGSKDINNCTVYQLICKSILTDGTVRLLYSGTFINF